MYTLKTISLNIAWMLLVSAANAQPYASVSVGVNAGFSTYANEFGSWWDVSPAALVSARTPFYVGQIEAGALGFRNADTIGENDFSAGLFFAGWGPTLEAGSVAEWRTTAFAGDLLMLFDEGGSGYSRRENELALGIKSTIVFELIRNTELEAGVVGFRTFTSSPIDLLFISAGIRYRIAISPRFRAWLQ